MAAREARVESHWPSGPGRRHRSMSPSQETSSALPQPFSSAGGKGLSMMDSHARISAPVTFVLGGARSGKSAFAERLVTAHRPPWTYIATAEAFDDEMRQRIGAHQARRGADWRTVEAPQDLVRAIRQAPGDQALLVDCLTLWLSNRLLAGADLPADRAALIEALRLRAAPTVVVSSEVGLSIVPENGLARAFRDAAGELHQSAARLAAYVNLIVAGYPITAKPAPVSARG
jgi:adenosylcobinamide kinase/adenosylcobinamide-phosphate guanylyltransferase